MKYQRNEKLGLKKNISSFLDSLKNINVKYKAVSFGKLRKKQGKIDEILKNHKKVTKSSRCALWNFWREK